MTYFNRKNSYVKGLKIRSVVLNLSEHFWLNEKFAEHQN